MTIQTPSGSSRHRVVIVGGGFGGLYAARSLGHDPEMAVTLVDRRNFHLFQPMLYQVATGALSPGEIAQPLRSVLRKQRNTTVILGEAIGLDPERRHVLMSDGGPIDYDTLIVATGAHHTYFGHDEWAALAPGLKTLEDATELRRRILLAFESAEHEGSEDARRAGLTFGIVGGGPTGVELAGAIQEIAGRTLPADYRNIDTRTTRVLLFEGGPRLLPSFGARLGERARRDLERMGVEVRLGALVTDVTREGLRVGPEFIPVRNVFWAAGVESSPLGRTLGVPLDRAGRVLVGPDLAIPEHPEVFVAGDMAAARSADTEKPVPGVAQGGIQMGGFAGRTIADEVSGRRERARRRAFIYKDRGSMAVIGKARAVAEIGRFACGGFLA